LSDIPTDRVAHSHDQDLSPGLDIAVVAHGLSTSVCSCCDRVLGEGVPALEPKTSSLTRKPFMLVPTAAPVPADIRTAHTVPRPAQPGGDARGVRHPGDTGTGQSVSILSKRQISGAYSAVSVWSALLKAHRTAA